MGQPDLFRGCAKPLLAKASNYLAYPEQLMARFDQLLAMNLGLSRRQIAKKLAAGHIQDLEGQTLRDPKLQVIPPFLVRHQGQSLTLIEHAALLLHKPIGCVTALKDARHPTAYEHLRDAPLFGLLRPIGRLDLDTSGLLLWTTQGAQVHALTHPKKAVPRTYHVGLARPYQAVPSDFTLKDGHQPTILDLRELKAPDLHPGLDLQPGPTIFASITLQSGAYHEVRRIFAALQSHVLSLCRVSHGAWTLPKTLKAGHYELIDLDKPPGQASLGDPASAT